MPDYTGYMLAAYTVAVVTYVVYAISIVVRRRSVRRRREGMQ